MKPMLASNYEAGKVRFPIFAQPKIDGVRGLNIGGNLVGRSLKTHGNRFTTDYYSRLSYNGFDGELAAGHMCDSDLCRETTSAMNTVQGCRVVNWHVFDLFSNEALKFPYWRRLEMLHDAVKGIATQGEWGKVFIIENTVVENMEELEAFEAHCMSSGYEGVIIRSPSGMHKQGRSTPNEGGLLRIKRFVEREAIVDELIEGKENNNIAQYNELGNTFRSSHKENLDPNGMIGAMMCTDIESGQKIKVSAGKLNHNERTYFFENPKEILRKVIKYQSFPVGVKDAPRFPTFQSFKIASDTDPGLAKAVDKIVKNDPTVGSADEGKYDPTQSFF